VSLTNRYRVIPFSSTRICPSFPLLATATLVPVAAGLGDGLALAVEGLEPHAAASTVITVNAPAANNFPFMHPDTFRGYEIASQIRTVRPQAREPVKNVALQTSV